MQITRGPIAETDIPLTPRERGIKRTGSILLAGALANAAMAGIAGLLGIIAGVGASALFGTVANLFLPGFDGLKDAALIIIMLLCLGNLAGLLVLNVGVTAQEFWAPGAVVVLMLANLFVLGWLIFVPALVTIAVLIWTGRVMLRDLRAYRVNPLMLKELRERMRGARAFIVITVYLGLMSGFAVLLYLIETNAGSASGTSVTGELGRNLFRGIVGLQLLLIIFIAPAFTSGAIANERERKTYDLLQITLLPHPSFIIGKLESALGYILLLLLAAIPLQSIAFLFGGVSEQELILSFVILAVTAITLGTVGLFFSALVSRTLTASVRAYTAALIMLVGVPLGLAFILDIAEQIFDQGVDTPAAVQAFFIYADSFVTILNPATAALATQDLLITGQGPGFYTERLSDGTVIPLAAPWITLTILYLTTAAVLTVLAVQAMRREIDEEEERQKQEETPNGR